MVEGLARVLRFVRSTGERAYFGTNCAGFVLARVANTRCGGHRGSSCRVVDACSSCKCEAQHQLVFLASLPVVSVTPVPAVGAAPAPVSGRTHFQCLPNQRDGAFLASSRKVVGETAATLDSLREKLLLLRRSGSVSGTSSAPWVDESGSKHD